MFIESFKYKKFFNFQKSLTLLYTDLLTRAKFIGVKCVLLYLKLNTFFSLRSKGNNNTPATKRSTLKQKNFSFNQLFEKRFFLTKIRFCWRNISCWREGSDLYLDNNLETISVFRISTRPKLSCFLTIDRTTGFFKPG